MGLLKKHSAKSVNYFSAHLKDAKNSVINRTQASG